jgi:hypothetical protein
LDEPAPTVVDKPAPGNGDDAPIAAGISPGGPPMTQAMIWQRLHDEQGLQASVASFKRWVAANLSEEVQRDRVTVLGDDPAPGSEAQIGYAHLGSWIDPRTGKKRRVWAFVMVLPASRHMFVRQH